MSRGPAAAEMPRWRVFGESALGAAHAAQHLPNQDAFGFLPRDGFGSPVIVAVADGHGSTRSFRSDVGALIAVNTAIRCLWSRIKDTARSPFEESEREDIARAITERWRQKIAREVRKHPFTETELTKLSGAAGRRSSRTVQMDPTIAYGTTLLCVAVTSDRLVFFQLGDGDILTVTKYGGVERVLPVDELIWADQTTSMAMPDAWRHVRMAVRLHEPDDPALVLLSTDGYASSFATDEAFFQVGSDLYHMLRESTVDEIRRDLRGWLDETSRLGAGDDITLGVLCHLPVLGSGRSATIPDISTEEIDFFLEDDLEETKDALDPESLPGGTQS